MSNDLAPGTVEMATKFVDKLNSNALRSVLEIYGLRSGPITGSTTSVYKRMLLNFLLESCGNVADSTLHQTSLEAEIQFLEQLFCLSQGDGLATASSGQPIGVPETFDKSTNSNLMPWIALCVLIVAVVIAAVCGGFVPNSQHHDDRVEH